MVVPLLLTLMEVLFYAVGYFKQDWSEHSASVEIMSDCTGYKTRTIRWIVEHHKISELKEIPGAYLLYFDAKTYLLIPTREFSKKQRTEFREVVTSRVYAEAPGHGS